MSDWIKDAAWITAVGTVFGIATGRFGSAIAWMADYMDRARERRSAQKTVRTALETIDLKDMELEVKDRIIMALNKENSRLATALDRVVGERDYAQAEAERIRQETTAGGGDGDD